MFESQITLIMENVRILHNPEAGDSLFSKETLTGICEKYGFNWSYHSLKKPGWDHYSEKDEMVLLCGGDGSIQKVLESFLGMKRIIPIALIPGGTANNISKNLPHYSFDNPIVQTDIAKLDHGTVSGSLRTPFFIESCGIGLLSHLIKKMSDYNSDGMESAEKIKTARNELLKITRGYSGFQCEIKTNGEVLRDTYLMVEILNSPSVGPNLTLADDCKPADGKLNLVTVTTSERADFESYLSAVIEGYPGAYKATSILTDQLDIKCADGPLHVDDEHVGTIREATFQIQLHKEMFPVFVVKT